MVFWTAMLAVGCAVGLISAGLGMGGGILMVPAFLEFIPAMDPHTAKGTSLFVITFVALANAWRLNRQVPDRAWGAAAVISCGSIVGSLFAVWLTSLLSGKALVLVFVIFIGVTGLRTFFIKPRELAVPEGWTRQIWSVGIGVMTGIVAGATGIGGGAVLVPLALMAGVTSNRRVVALSNMVMTVTCAAGALAHLWATETADLPWTYGQVTLGVAPLVFVGSQLGAPLGDWVNKRLTLTQRKVIMGVILVTIALRLLQRSMS